jgi:hypothetical protein
MKQVPDRIKLRREYLRKKAGAYVAGTASGILIIPSLILTVLCVIGALAVVVLNVMPLSRFGIPELAALCVFIGSATVFGAFTWEAWDKLKAAQKAARLTYVPPVTPDALPADEILVRSSEEPPVAQSEVLLRAAQRGQETPKEELLRVSQEPLE